MNEIIFRLRKGKIGSGAPLAPNLRPLGIDVEKVKRLANDVSSHLPEGTRFYFRFYPSSMTGDLYKVPLSSKIINFLGLPRKRTNTVLIEKRRLIPLIEEHFPNRDIDTCFGMIEGLCRSMNLRIA